MSSSSRKAGSADPSLDPELQAVRTQEKDQIKSLNDRFASFIDKVRKLEQENKVLETKWDLLQKEPKPESQLEPMLKAHIGSLQTQLEQGKREREHLDAALRNAHAQLDKHKQRYEEEINNRNKSENDFVVLKKDVDAAYLCKNALEETKAANLEELDFLKRFYEQELHELVSKPKGTSVVVQMDNSRELDMKKFISEVKGKYEEISASSRKEAEAWSKNKFEMSSLQADQCTTEIKNNKSAIAGLKRQISRLQNDIASAKSQCETVDEQIKEVDRSGEEAVLDARQQIKSLEDALQKAKQEMAKQIRDYQELMNVKLTLDIEIATYKKLLEGEENRIGREPNVNIYPVHKRQ